jgi:DNA-binding transcriptional LysR family regulator
MGPITLRQIQGFVQICGSGGFTIAAPKLGLTQSGISLLLQSLERAIGAQLIQRPSRTLVLTEAGRRFLPIAKRILDDVELAAGAGQQAGQRRGRITVAALPTLAAALLPQAITAFRADAPGIDVQVRDMLTDEIVDSVRRGDAHFGLGAFLQRSDDLVMRQLFRDRLVALASAALIAKKVRSIGWSELGRLPLILMGRDSNIRGLTDLAFFEHRIDVRPAFEVQYVTTAIALARAGLAIAVIPRLEAAAVADPLVRMMPINDPPMWREIGILTRRNATLTATQQQFVDQLALANARSTGWSATSRQRVPK